MCQCSEVGDPDSTILWTAICNLIHGIVHCPDEPAPEDMCVTSTDYCILNNTIVHINLLLIKK